LCWPEVLRPSGKRDLGAVGAVVVVVVVVVILGLGFGLGLDLGRSGWIDWTVFYPENLSVGGPLFFELGDCLPGRGVN
jgi:hypothetical protein